MLLSAASDPGWGHTPCRWWPSLHKALHFVCSGLALNECRPVLLQNALQFEFHSCFLVIDFGLCCSGTKTLATPPAFLSASHRRWMTSLKAVTGKVGSEHLGKVESASFVDLNISLFLCVWGTRGTLWDCANTLLLVIPCPQIRAFLDDSWLKQPSPWHLPSGDFLFLLFLPLFLEFVYLSNYVLPSAMDSWILVSFCGL